MNCQKCGYPITRTLADNTVSLIKRYVTAAYYCDACDAIFVLDKNKDKFDERKFDGELPWLREQNPLLNGQQGGGNDGS